MRLPPVTNRPRLLVLSAALFAVALYVGFVVATAQPGYPLDDAWIHQTYARNLVRTGRWEYTPGTISAGSTAPLWTLLLAVGYFLSLPHFLWSALLGALSLAWLALAGMQLWELLWPAAAGKAWLAGLAIVFSWQLIWAAASGMETILFAALALWVLVYYLRTEPVTEPPALALLGLLSGLLILARPDGLVLLLLVVLGLNLRPQPLRRRFRQNALLLAAASAPLLPYLLFNLSAAGRIWPNTFYAKQAEYAQLLAQPILTRATRLLYFSLGGPETGWQGSSGPQLFLLPGLIVAVWLACKRDWAQRRLRHTLPILWAGGHVLLYAWRLPVTYQHGRYLLPAIPLWILFGLAGSSWLLLRLPPGIVSRLARRVAGLSFVALVLVFSLLGAQAYAADVAFIQGEMVAVARWLVRNTAEDALIASHDIGALGYFAQRPLLDLAGLITPDIIPWLTNEDALSQYVLRSSANYLVTAPGWPYESATASERARLVYTTDFAWTQQQGVNNMAVYRLLPP